MHTSSLLSGLLRPEDYQARTSHVFPGLESLRWYIRRQRPLLTESGALLFIAGKSWIHPDKFDACVLRAGARNREVA